MDKGKIVVKTSIYKDLWKKIESYAQRHDEDIDTALRKIIMLLRENCPLFNRISYNSTTTGIFFFADSMMARIILVTAILSSNGIRTFSL